MSRKRQEKTVEKDVKEKMAEHKKKAKRVFGDLDFDDLPDAPKRAEIPFPYGSDKARPYGWDFK